MLRFVHLSVCPMALAQKWCILGLWLLQNTNRKPHAGSQTVCGRNGRSILFHSHLGDILCRPTRCSCRHRYRASSVSSLRRDSIHFAHVVRSRFYLSKMNEYIFELSNTQLNSDFFPSVSNIAVPKLQDYITSK